MKNIEIRNVGFGTMLAMILGWLVVVILWISLVVGVVVGVGALVLKLLGVL